MTYRLGEVCTITKGKIGISKATEGDFPLVVTAEERKSHNEYHFETKAVIVPLVSSTGHGHASLKRVHYQEGKFAVGNILCVIEPIDLDLLIPKYLHVYLSYFKDTLLVPLMRGAANVSLSIKSIKTVEIEIPSLEIQEKIIDLTEHLQEKVDNLSEHFESEMNLIKQLRQAILQEAIQGKLVPQNPNDEPALVLLERIKTEKAELIKTKKIRKQKPLSPISEDEIPFELPENWIWCRLGEITILENGDRSNNYPSGSSVLSEGIPFINSKTLIGGKLDLDSPYLQYISNEKFHSLRSGKVENGDILVVLRGATRGKAGVFLSNGLHRTGFINAQLIILRTMLYSNIYLLKYLLTNTFKESVEKDTSGSAQPHISGNNISNTLFPLPPLSEQKRIVEKVEELMLMCERLEEQVKGSAKDAEVLMQAVLQEAFG